LLSLNSGTVCNFPPNIAPSKVIKIFSILQMPIKLVVGLGNPGPEYAFTRHNVGFMALDRLALDWRAQFSLQGRWKAACARHGDLYLLKPLTYMNLSGESVAACRSFYKIKPEEILVVYDDVALPLGKLRLRPEGSAGGQNGMRSIIQHLGTQSFPRMRIGIGGSEKSSLSGHVLGKFGPDEQDALNKVLDRAVDAVKVAVLRGWDLAMNQFNSDPEQVKKPKPPRPPKPQAPPRGDNAEAAQQAADAAPLQNTIHPSSTTHEP
jgi:peptidyl-tRNA hydrolase, PTH1 family